MKGEQEMDGFLRNRFQSTKGSQESCLGSDVTFFGALMIGQFQQLNCIAVAEPVGAHAGWQMVAVPKKDLGQVFRFGDPDSVELFLIGESRQLEASADIPQFLFFEFWSVSLGSDKAAGMYGKLRRRTDRRPR